MKKNLFNLKGKTVLVTGAAGLLAKQHINAVLNNEGDLVLIDLNIKYLKNIKKILIKKFKNKIEIFKGDVTKINDIKKIYKILLKKKIKVNVLINNASVNYQIDSKHKKLANKVLLETFDTKIWKKDLDVGLLGSLNCIKVFGNAMAKNKYGIILNIASDLSLIAPDNRIYNSNNKISLVKPVSYSVVKHGITGLTRYVAAYWARNNVRCNAIAPGGVFNNQPKNFLNKVSKLIPMGRLAKKGEYESSILYLISDASSYMNGAVVSLDGGRTII